MAIRLLLVDDDPTARFLFRTILGDHPEQFEIVGETGRASEALDLLAKTRPDVVVLDAVMPMMDGYELAGEILAAVPDARLVLLSSYVDEQVRRKAAAAGIHACVDKGDFATVPQVVTKTARREPGASAAPG